MRFSSCLCMLNTNASSAGRILSWDRLSKEKSAEITMIENNVINRMIRVLRLVVISFLISVLASCSENQYSKVIIKDPHLYVPLNGSMMTSGYLGIYNESSDIIEIKGIDCSPIRAEIHETKMNSQEGMSMKKIDSFLLEPGENSIFVPGGKHVMFWGLNNYNSEYLRCIFLVSAGQPIEINFLVEERG